MSNNGGPAFPCEQHETQSGDWNQSYEPGMTLRDYFAAKAMQSIVQATSTPYFHDGELLLRTQGVDQTANFSYMVADAMLKAREQS